MAGAAVPRCLPHGLKNEVYLTPRLWHCNSVFTVHFLWPGILQSSPFPFLLDMRMKNTNGTYFADSPDLKSAFMVRAACMGSERVRMFHPHTNTWY